MQCSDVAQVIERDGFSPLPEAARGHVAGCSTCSLLIADFEHMVTLAREIPAEVQPPARVWVSLRAQLEAEGLIRETPVVVPVESVPWWQGIGQFVGGRMVVTAAVAVLIVAAGYFQMTHKRALSPLPNTAAAVTQPGIIAEPFADPATSLDREEESLGPVQPASLSAGSPIDNSLRENLATLNTFIKECRKRLQEDPNDQVARDYLSAAYQQKAEILAAMMERGRSVN